MGYLKYVKEAWKKPHDTMPAETKKRLIDWRREEATVKLEYPTRIDRARSLGFKAKQGIIVVRQRVSVHYRKRERPAGGRRSKTSRMSEVISKSYKQIAEERASKKFTNMQVLNSYWVGTDAKNHWYEIILVDPNHPVIQSDRNLGWLAAPQHTNRVMRGLTSSGRKTRGLRKKGTGAEKIRPSIRANKRLSH